MPWSRFMCTSLRTASVGGAGASGERLGRRVHFWRLPSNYSRGHRLTSKTQPALTHFTCLSVSSHHIFTFIHVVSPLLSQGAPMFYHNSAPSCLATMGCALIGWGWFCTGWGKLSCQWAFLMCVFVSLHGSAADSPLWQTGLTSSTGLFFSPILFG